MFFHMYSTCEEPKGWSLQNYRIGPEEALCSSLFPNIEKKKKKVNFSDIICSFFQIMEIPVVSLFLYLYHEADFLSYEDFWRSNLESALFWGGWSR